MRANPILRTTVVTQQTLRCPITGRREKVEVLLVGFPGLRRAQDMLACSAFEPETAISCDRQCLKADSFRLRVSDHEA